MDRFFSFTLCCNNKGNNISCTFNGTPRQRTGIYRKVDITSVPPKITYIEEPPTETIESKEYRDQLERLKKDIRITITNPK